MKFWEKYGISNFTALKYNIFTNQVQSYQKTFVQFLEISRIKTNFTNGNFELFDILGTHLFSIP